MSEYSTTQPVILIGTEEKQLKGFKEIQIVVKGKTYTFRGDFTIQMINESLRFQLQISQEEDKS
jgi:hypothetical protein